MDRKILGKNWEINDLNKLENKPNLIVDTNVRNKSMTCFEESFSKMNHMFGNKSSPRKF